MARNDEPSGIPPERGGVEVAVQIPGISESALNGGVDEHHARVMASINALGPACGKPASKPNK